MRWPSRVRQRTRRWWLGFVLPLIVLLLAAPPLADASGLTKITTGIPPAGLALPTVAVPTVGGYIGSHHYNPFYAVQFNDYGLGPNAAADLGNFFNSTPFKWFRLGEGGIGYDPTTTTNWVAPVGGGAFVANHTEMINLTWFKAWCYSKNPHCNWIGALPAEENDTAAAVHFAEYFHNVLGFPPTAWELGNEPDVWTHWGKNESTWSTYDNSTPTGIAYATMVHNYVTAVSALFPADKFIGIEANCACNPGLVTTTAQVDGPLLWTMAYHSYPWANDSSKLPSEFMGSLQSPRNLSSTAARMRQLVTNGCASCASMPVDVGEYNAGPVPVHSPLAMNYSGAPFMAASIIEAIDANVTQLTFYSLGWLYNTSSTSVLPEGLLYQRILDNMSMGKDYPVNFTVSGVGGLYGLLVKAGTKESLLIVNTNITKAVTITIPTTLFPILGNGTVRSWDPRSAYPTTSSLGLLTLTYTVWSQGILLLNNY